MSLSQDDVKKIARLSRLSFCDSEFAEAHNKLNNVFALIEKMQSVNTEGVEPMSHPQDMALRLREDEVTEQNHREEYQKVAPQVQDGLYLVPKVIE
ncbi:Asp-tRNA(Asn)/Glu-tRNA(Gln) amidotransferase subunit GatC [Neisseria sp. Ec49-e6-T10]|uniref:Asp-tRNA(Asn)/Glu-tRNA(Gln) amidotransferase subunit GatC n=1 Tax=Neisseria sp. Ec49-e6-T10 TaxID=3140744 RepID=UPI003EBF1532